MEIINITDRDKSMVDEWAELSDKFWSLDESTQLMEKLETMRAMRKIMNYVHKLGSLGMKQYYVKELKKSNERNNVTDQRSKL